MTAPNNPPQPEQPRLLAKRSQHGYVTINPLNPDATAHRALHREPEPIRADQHEALQYRKAIQRQQTTATVLAGLNHLTAAANGRERRQLANAQRIIKSSVRDTC